jgi:hypothetical protein
VTLIDIPGVLLSAAAFIALWWGVDLPLVVAAGLLLSVLLFR